jgi:hypothetical protein
MGVKCPVICLLVTGFERFARLEKSAVVWETEFYPGAFPDPKYKSIADEGIEKSGTGST